jgi:ribosome-binding ATPase YchF (GTP1/OBG family)
VQQVIDKAIYELLKLIVVYPVEDENKLTDKKGNVLSDSFLVPQGTTARGLAYLIHTELGDSFLYAVDARTKMRKGEDYVLKDRDIIRIVATKGR